ncbi:MAG: EpsI family protein [Proteobacteria bacterium]|nr:EpsI family protein [Pseudomonadota bacterium]
MNMTAMASGPPSDTFNYKAIWIGLAMILAAVMAVAMKPTQKLAGQGEAVNLEMMIPRQFGDWKVNDKVPPLLPDERTQGTLKKIYSQTLSRTYRNDGGGQVMLSIAYGDSQNDLLQVHKPEVCYTAQGFQILREFEGAFSALSGERIPVKRLLAVQGDRVEPITYWITVGETVSANSLGRKLAQLKYGLTGRIPDGLLFRVSSIGSDAQAAYEEQVEFSNALLAAMDRKDRARLIGPPVK